MKKASRAQEGAPIADTDLNHFEGNPDFVLSLARGLKVIEAFQGQTDGMTVADIASRTRLSRAAVRRLLLT
ncbi:MAG: helix-turn-helix domain-containing protein, partial [Acidobacteriaceae bacterium]|nr:helix-turn-helix domain-containing protein [Acidobacteriaceae bacterium]